MSVVLRLETERNRVHAEPVAGGSLRRVLENVAKVGAAIAAQNLDAFHAEGAIFAKHNGVLLRRNVEAWPSAVGIKLRVAAKKLSAARFAAVDTLTLFVQKFAGPRPFRGGLSQHRELFSAQLLAPHLVAFCDLVVHRDTFPETRGVPSTSI